MLRLLQIAMEIGHVDRRTIEDGCGVAPSAIDAISWLTADLRNTRFILRVEEAIESSHYRRSRVYRLLSCRSLSGTWR